MATPLGNLERVPWDEIKDSKGSAEAIPFLLDTVAWGMRQRPGRHSRT